MRRTMCAPYKTIKLLLINSLLLAAMTSTAHAADCSAGKSAFKQILSSGAGNAEKIAKINGFNQTYASCQSLMVKSHLVAGDLNARERNWQQANENYTWVVENLQGQSKWMELATTKQALAEYQLGTNQCAAMQKMQEIENKYHKQGMPKAIKGAYLAFKEAQYETTVSSEVINCALGNQSRSFRDFGVCPRIDLRVLFDYNSDAIRAESRSQVRELAKALSDSSMSQYKFKLIGHTDVRGSNEYNQQLSERRAKSVRSAINKQSSGMAGRFKVAGKGESEPLSNGSSERDHQLNRRVEVQIQCF